MAVLDIGRDLANDPFATTTDDISEFWHVQSTGFGGNYRAKAVPAVNYPVGTPSRVFFTVPHVIDRSDLTGSRPIKVVDTTIGSTMTRVAAAPTGNEYRIPPASSIRRDVIEVSSTKVGNILDFDFYGEGSVFNADEFNTFRQYFAKYETAVNYQILDTDYVGYIEVAHTAATGLITITLPTVADNIERRIRIQNTGLGLTKVDGEGAETISYKGNALSVFYLVGEDDYVDLISNGTEWKVLHCYMHIESGLYNRSDWTNVHIGLANFDYDNQSDSSDRTGWKYVLDSGVTGLVLEDSAPSGNSGTYTVCFVTGTGLAINDEEVTFGDAVTADVNEGTGNNKNQDWNITHNMATNIKDYKLSLIWNTTASYTDAYFISLTPIGEAYGFIRWQIDTNNLKLQTPTAGFIILNDSGIEVAVATTDSYNNIILEIKS